MGLRNITTANLPLYEAIHLDPVMMEHLGGPLPEEGLAQELDRDAEATREDRYWVLVIVPDDDPDAVAGTIAI